MQFTGIVYRDGEKTEGETRSIEVDRRIGWSRKHDNRAGGERGNRERQDRQSFNETFNKLRTFTSLDLIQRFSASAKGEVLGIGGSVTSSTEAHAHTEVETEKFARTKQETILEDHVRIAYPGPIRDDAGRHDRAWRHLADRTASGDAAYHHADNAARPCGTARRSCWTWRTGRVSGAAACLPDGEHWNVLKFAGLHDLAAFMRKDLVLRYKWLPKPAPER